MCTDISPAGGSARPPPFTGARRATDNTHILASRRDMSGGAMVVDRDLVVTARDGVGLATDVYRPAAHGPFPVLLERTPNDKSAPSRSARTAAVAAPRSRAEVAAYFVRHGYAVIYQDCRGRYKSGGRFTKYLSEAEDGCDTLAWLARQSWCDGRIGTFGLSYAAHTQAALGCLDPGSGRPVPRLRRGFQRLSQRHPPRWRFRFETGDLGLQQRAGRHQGPRHQGGAQRTGHQRVVRADAMAQGRFAAQCGAGIRGLPVRGGEAWHVRRFLEAAGHLCGRLLRPLCRRAGRQPLRLVRSLFADGGGELPWPVAAEARPGSADPPPVGPPRPLA